MTDEEQAAVRAENEEQPKSGSAPAEQTAQTNSDAADNFGMSPEDNFSGGFEDNFGLGDSLLSNGTLPPPPPAPKKKAPAPPVTPRNREAEQPQSSVSVLSADPSSLSAAATAPSLSDDDGEPVISVNAGGAKPKAASGTFNT